MSNATETQKSPVDVLDARAEGYDHGVRNLSPRAWRWPTRAARRSYWAGYQSGQELAVAQAKLEWIDSNYSNASL